MLSRVRKFLKNNSPDWLNTEVNKDLLQNLTTSLSQGSNEYPNKSQITDTSISSSSFPSLEEVKPSLNKSLPGEVKRSQKKSYTKELQLSTSNLSLFPTPGTPHWRRIKQVFQALDTAPENATYNQLIEYVRETTGEGCSRKLISKWKKYRQNPDLLPVREERSNERDRQTNIVSVSPAITTRAAIPSTVNRFQLNQSVDNFSNNDSLNRPTLLPIKTWSYLAAAGITIALVGCELVPLTSDRPTENITIASVTAPITPLPPRPERRNRLEPRNIKIELTLSHPQDLKVKPGDKVTAGQTLSDRLSERNRLQAKKKQLQLSLEKLNLPLTPIPKPKPIPQIAKLPPVSYAESEAAIKLHKQKLTEANRAIAIQQKKIDSLAQILTNPSPKPINKPATGESNLKLVIEHEQANLKNLEAAQQSAQIQLEVAQSKLTTAKEQRAYLEYQRQLEQTRRAIALEQRNQAIASQQSARARMLAEREYSKAQIETQIQALDYQIIQLSSVRAPYEGTIKKVKWTGQSDHNLTAVITLAVDSVTSQQSTVTSNTEPINNQQ